MPTASAPSAGSGASAPAGKSAGAPKAAAAPSANPFARHTAKRAMTRQSGARRRTR